jgi:small subunit ribosomal protein S2
MNVTLEDLLKSGVHFGHLTRRWNPKMRPYIFMERNNIHIIDLKKTLEQLKIARDAMKQIVLNGDSVLFVGTKQQAKNIIIAEATRAGMFYMTERWLGGTLTNFATIKKSIRKLENLEKMVTDGTAEKMTKKERLMMEREIEKMKSVFAGIQEMRRLPGALFVVDTKKEEIAVKEGRKLGIPIFAIVDTNCDPEEVDYPIPGNDDSTKSIGLITKVMADACLEAKNEIEAKKASEKEVEQKA